MAEPAGRARFVVPLLLTPFFVAALATVLLATLLLAPVLLTAAIAATFATLPWGSFPKGRIAGVAIVVIALVSGAKAMIREIDARQDALFATIQSGGPRALTTFDRSGIFALGLAMVPGGLVAGYPEVAKEQLLLYVPGPPSRDFESDFAMRSDRVRDPLRKWGMAVKTGVSATMPPERLAFRYGRDDLRVTLALNPALLTASFDGMTIHATAEVDVRYVARSRITLGKLDDVPLYAEEGLFHALQELGWLHPYAARWHWDVFPGDLEKP